jgi:hypothetical protein
MISRGVDIFKGDYIQDRRSGAGYELFLPSVAKSLEDASVSPDVPVLFTELGRVADLAMRYGALLVFGEPGSGKSHLRDDITTALAIENNVPYLSVSLHINGSKITGPQTLQNAVTRLKRAGDGQKLVFVDNIDYLGYKGHRRYNLVSKYTAETGDLLQELVEDDDLCVIGSAHDQEWRDGNWKWADESINQKAQDVLDVFPLSYEFRGDLTEKGREEVAHMRGIDPLFASRLASDGLGTFFHVRHLDPMQYSVNPEMEVSRIEQIRRGMKTR